MCFHHPDHSRGQDAGILSDNDSLLAGTAGYTLIRRRPTGISARDARLLAFFALAAALVGLTYARSLPGMSASPGIIPDMRYLSPTYLPMLVVGVYASTPVSTVTG